MLCLASEKKRRKKMNEFIPCSERISQIPSKLFMSLINFPDNIINRMHIT